MFPIVTGMVTEEYEVKNGTRPLAGYSSLFNRISMLQMKTGGLLRGAL